MDGFKHLRSIRFCSTYFLKKSIKRGREGTRGDERGRFEGTTDSNPLIIYNEKATICALSKELKWWLNYMIVLWIRAVFTYLSHRCEQRCFSHDFYSHSIVEGGFEEMS